MPVTAKQKKDCHLLNNCFHSKAEIEWQLGKYAAFGKQELHMFINLQMLEYAKSHLESKLERLPAPVVRKPKPRKPIPDLGFSLRAQKATELCKAHLARNPLRYHDTGYNTLYRGKRIGGVDGRQIKFWIVKGGQDIRLLNVSLRRLGLVATLDSRGPDSTYTHLRVKEL